MTILGEYLSAKFINKINISRKIGISKSSLSELERKETTKLKADEFFLINLAICVFLEEISDKTCSHVKSIKVK